MVLKRISENISHERRDEGIRDVLLRIEEDVADLKSEMKQVKEQAKKDRETMRKITDLLQSIYALYLES